MKNNKVHQSFVRHTVPSRLSRTNRSFPILAFIAVFAGCLLAGTVGQAAPVNLLYFPLTNAPGNTFMPSSTSLGGVNVNLNSYSATGTALDFGGAVGTGVNGLATGARAMCTTNGNGGTQPGNETGNYSGANPGNSAADNGTTGDANLAFGAVHDFVVTMWFNQPFKAPSGSGFVLPRLFVLSTGSGAGANDGTANSIGVKFQLENQFIFSIGTSTLTTTYTSDLTTNKWYFVAWVYDNTNIYQYTGSDAASATLQNQFAAPGLVETFGNPSTLILANRQYKGARAFNGWMEDFRFYTNVASAGNNASLVESIRKSIAPKIPTITGIYPDGTSLLQATNTFVFTANSPSGFNITNVTLNLNGNNVSSGLTIVSGGPLSGGGSSTTVTASYSPLPLQSINTAVISATDSLGLVGTASVTFDTFNPTNFIVKAEEFDHDSGLFIDNPDYTATNGDANSYFGLAGTQGTDVYKGGSTGDNQANDYRYDDGTGTDTQTPLAAGELPSPTRFGGNIVPSHMIGNWSSGEWQNYTKTFPAGNYNVYARLSTSSGSTVTFSQVTSGQGQPSANQVLSQLGQFTYTGSGAFQWVPLLQNGTLAVINLSGVNTVRATTGGGANADFYMLVPANSNLPVISNVYPDGNYLFEATNKLVFTVSSPAGINTNKITLTLNGTNFSSSLVFSGGPNTWNVSYTGLQNNQTYATVISVTDSNSASANATLSIDTWNPVMQVESEDFDFSGGQYIDNPLPTPPGVAAGNSYEGRVGTVGIDEFGASVPGHADYRPADAVATTAVTDTPRRQFTGGALAYNVGFLGSGFWQNYTKTWPSGTFNVYGRMASGANIGTIYSSWSTVIAGWGTTNEITRHIGSFAIPTTGGYSAYLYTPLIDRFGNYAQVTLGGTNTIRSTELVANQTETPNASYGLNVNFYMLLNARTDQARIDSVYPDGETQQYQTNTLSFVASSPAYGINTTNIHVTLNGVNISSNLVFSGSSGSWNVSYPGLQLNTAYTAVITVTDNNNQPHTTTVNFDTFNPNNFTWEAEDYDFDPTHSPIPNLSGLRYIDNPALTSVPASNSYVGQEGDGGQIIAPIDYAAVFGLTVPGTHTYRPLDYISAEVTSDTLRPKYQNAQLTNDNPYIVDYDVNYWATNGWINYTRTFPTGNFYLVARLSAGNGAFNLQCTQVTNGAGTASQMTNYLGSFKGSGTSFATWQDVYLTDAATNKIILPFGGVETLQFIGDYNEDVNYFELVPLTPLSPVITASVSGSNIQLSFPTQIGFSYTMYYKNNLTDPSWTQLGSPVPGNGAIESVTDSNILLSQNHRFYRLTITIQ
jgi:hypothetical protein